MRLYSAPPLAPSPDNNDEASWKQQQQGRGEHQLYQKQHGQHGRGDHGDSITKLKDYSSPNNRSVSFRVNESSRSREKQQRHPNRDNHWDEKKQDMDDSYPRPTGRASSSPSKNSSSSWKKNLGRDADRTSSTTTGSGRRSQSSPGRSRSHHTPPSSQQRRRRRSSRDRGGPQQQQQHQRSSSSSSLINTSSTTAGTSSTLSGASNGTGGSNSAGSSSAAGRTRNSSGSDKEDAWRKPGRSFRARLILHDEKQGGAGKNNRLVALSTECSIEKYYRVADKVLDQFLQHPIDTRQDMLEAYLLGTRLCKFLSSMLPTHPDYFVGASFDQELDDSEGNKQQQRSSPLHEELDAKLLTAARKRSQEQLTDLLQYVEELALIVDREEHQAYISRVLDHQSNGNSDSNTSGPPPTSSSTSAIQLQQLQHPSSTIMTTEEEEEALNNTTMSSSTFTLQQLKLKQLEAKRLEREKKKREQQQQMQTTSRRSPSMASSSFQEEKKEDGLVHSMTPLRNVTSKTSTLTSSVMSSHQHSDLSSRALTSSSMASSAAMASSAVTGSNSMATKGSTQPPSPAATSTSSHSSTQNAGGPEWISAPSEIQDDLFWSCNTASTTVLAQQQQPPSPCGPSMRIDPSDVTHDNSFSNRLLATRTNLRSTPSPTKLKTLISNLDRVQEERTRSPSTELLALSHIATNESSFNSESPLLQRDNSESTIEVKHVAGTEWDVAWSRAGSSSDVVRSRSDKKKKDLSSLTRSTSASSATTTSSAASSIYSDEFKRRTDAEEAAARQEWTPLKSADSFEKTGLSTPPRQTISMRSSPPDSPFRSRSGNTPPKLDDSNETHESDDTEKLLASSRRPKRKPKKEVMFPVEEEPAFVVAKDGSLLRRAGRNSPRASISNTLPIIEDTNEPFHDDDTMEDLNFCSPPYVTEGAPVRPDAMTETAGAESWNSSTPGCWKKRLERTQQNSNSIRGIDVTPDGLDYPLRPNESSLARPAYPTHPLEFDDWKHGPWANIRSSSSSTVSTNRSGQAQSLPSPKIVRKMRYCKKFLDLEFTSEATVPPENSDDGGSKLDQSLASMATTRKQRALEPFKMCVKCLLE